jgi:hypothetical protein
VEPLGALRGDRSELVYRVSARESVTFRFDAAGRLIEAELSLGDDVVQRIRIEPGEDVEPGGYRWPEEARYRDLGEFHEIRIEVTEIREHVPFESRIFRVAAR